MLKISSNIKIHLAKLFLLCYTSRTLCPCGGIGRRGRFKICCPSGLAGSSPAEGTSLIPNSENNTTDSLDICASKRVEQTEHIRHISGL